MKKLIIIIFIFTEFCGCSSILNFIANTPYNKKLMSEWKSERAYERCVGGGKCNEEVINNYWETANKYEDWKNSSPGDKWDDCKSYCFDQMLETGHYTDCYNKCYEEYRKNKRREKY